ARRAAAAARRARRARPRRSRERPPCPRSRLLMGRHRRRPRRHASGRSQEVRKKIDPMSADTAAPPRARVPRRAAKDDGPRASLKQLLPFLFEHKKVLLVVAVLSIVGAVATLAQPLVVGEVIARVQAGAGLG